MSLGFRTDLALLRLGGSTVTDRGDHLVVHTPDNPTFWWGNFLLLPAPPHVEDLDGWLDRFAAEHPTARHIALGFDGTSTVPADELLTHLRSPDRGFTVETSTVMTATTVHPPAHPTADAVVRTLESEDDWAQSVEVRLACDAEDVEAGTFGSADHRPFVVARAATARALCTAGHARWFGAFLGDRLVSQLGLVDAGDGLARFQSVETAPDARGRGLAGTLVYHASLVGLHEMGARTLVMVADPDYLAIRLYRSVGFAGTEAQTQASRPPR